MYGHNYRNRGKEFHDHIQFVGNNRGEGINHHGKDNTAVKEPTDLYSLERLANKWESKYPKTSKSCQEHRASLNTYFKYHQEVRTLIYTANIKE